MKLNSLKSEVSVPQRPHYSSWSNQFDISSVEPSMWVQLLERPTPYSHDEALLLCQHSDTEWVVWIPDCGEMVLHQSQFCK